MKTYLDYMKELSKDDIYESLLGYGLFAEKLPPCFSSVAFLNYCKTYGNNAKQKGYNYVTYDTIRNINMPRQLGIPNPFAYEHLCSCISDHWNEIINHFKKCTENQNYKVSRIHVRKLKGKDAIFEMNYKNNNLDPMPNIRLALGKQFIVNADISNCFPSIYTHSIPWAIIEKEQAKSKRREDDAWYNKLDKQCRNTIYNETNGILVGPHAYNIISEIVLCEIDRILVENGWKYLRHIDDYTAYVDSEEDAEKFLVDLELNLKKYKLTLNHKKTKISKLPVVTIEPWVRKIISMDLLTSYGKVNYTNCQRYLDYAIEVANANKEESVFKYVLKVLSTKDLTDSAKKYEQDMMFHLALIYPYLVPLLDDYIFGVCNSTRNDIELIADKIYSTYMPKLLYEAVAYSLYWCIKYDLTIERITAKDIIQSDDCILKLMSYFYFKKNQDINNYEALEKHARECQKDQAQMERNWIFVYEVLSEAEFDGTWKAIKKNKVSFVDFK